jgi:hypothetical protein
VSETTLRSKRDVKAKSIFFKGASWISLEETMYRSGSAARDAELQDQAIDAQINSDRGLLSITEESFLMLC